MSKPFFEDAYYSIYTQGNEISYIRMVNEVLIVPMTATGEVILTVEPSVAFNVPTLILPGGAAELDEAHEQTALRELQEEIGYTAARLDYLGEVRPLSKYIALQTFIYIARDLKPSKLQGDEDYEIVTKRVPLKDFEELIAKGQLLDAHIIAALYMARSFLERLAIIVCSRDSQTCRRTYRQHASQARSPDCRAHRLPLLWLAGYTVDRREPYRRTDQWLDRPSAPRSHVCHRKSYVVAALTSYLAPYLKNNLYRSTYTFRYIDAKDSN